LIFPVVATLLPFMRALLAAILLFALVFSGCARKKPDQQPSSSSPRAGTATAPAKAVSAAEVLRVNPVGMFVVLRFPPHKMPVMDQRLNVYRQGTKVAEVKVTNWQRDNNVVADIVMGAPEVGDEARAD
jgi:hypothetical protein